MAHFLYFQVFAAKKQSVSTIYYSAPERSYCLLSENGIVIRFFSQRLRDIEGRNKKSSPKSQQKNTETLNKYLLDDKLCFFIT